MKSQNDGTDSLKEELLKSQNNDDKLIMNRQNNDFDLMI